MNGLKTLENAQSEPINIGVCYGLPYLPTHGSLFSGIGGFDLAAERSGFNNVFHCEWNEFGQTILKHYWKNATQYGDITQTDFNVWRGKLDVLSGGFPCQDISIAGKKLGLAGQRSGMFYQNIRATEEARPKCAIWENVGEVINYLPEIISAYAEIGYCLSWHTLHAGWFGLPHERKRIYGIAFDTNCFGFNEVQKWIPVEIENPPVDEDLGNYSYIVEVKNGNKIQSSFFNLETGQWQSVITDIIINPTHWRLIEIE